MNYKNVLRYAAILAAFSSLTSVNAMIGEEDAASTSSSSSGAPAAPAPSAKFDMRSIPNTSRNQTKTFAQHVQEQQSDVNHASAAIKKIPSSLKTTTKDAFISHEVHHLKSAATIAKADAEKIMLDLHKKTQELEKRLSDLNGGNQDGGSNSGGNGPASITIPADLASREAAKVAEIARIQSEIKLNKETFAHHYRTYLYNAKILEEQGIENFKKSLEAAWEKAVEAEQQRAQQAQSATRSAPARR